MPAHQSNELLEQVGCIVGSGTRFRVILNREEGKAPMSKALEAPIVQVDVRQLSASDLMALLAKESQALDL